MVQADNFDFQQTAQALVRVVALALNHVTLFASLLCFLLHHMPGGDALKATLTSCDQFA